MYSMPLEMEISRKLYNLILDQFVKKDFNGGPSIRLSPIPIYFKFTRDKLSIPSRADCSYLLEYQFQIRQTRLKIPRTFIYFSIVEKMG